MSQRIVVVTGAAAGIGAKLTERLLATGHGVIAIDRTASLPEGVYAVQCDLGSARQVRACAAEVRHIVRSQGALVGLAHVAGAPGTQPPATVMAVNFLAARELVSALSDDFAPQACIVAVSSLAAQRCDWGAARLSAVTAASTWEQALALSLEGVDNGACAYEVSKRLLIHWVPSAIASLAGRGVRVNTVSPGPVATQMLKDFRVSMGVERIDAAERLAGRHAEADEIAAPIAFLLSREASWLNGIDLRADGGLQALREWQGRTAIAEGDCP